MIRSAEVARHLNADPSLVARWVRRGMPLTSLPEALAWHAAAIKPRRRSDATTPPELAAEPAPSGSMSARLLEARLLREQSDASTAALKLAELRGDLLRRDLMESIVSARAAGLRESVMLIRSRLAPLLAAENDVHKVAAMLDTELRAALGAGLPERVL
jgi:hypothetical protein